MTDRTVEPMTHAWTCRRCGGEQTIIVAGGVAIPCPKCKGSGVDPDGPPIVEPPSGPEDFGGSDYPSDADKSYESLEDFHCPNCKAVPRPTEFAEGYTQTWAHCSTCGHKWQVCRECKKRLRSMAHISTGRCHGCDAKLRDEAKTGEVKLTAEMADELRESAMAQLKREGMTVLSKRETQEEEDKWAQEIREELGLVDHPGSLDELVIAQVRKLEVENSQFKHFLDMAESRLMLEAGERKKCQRMVSKRSMGGDLWDALFMYCLRETTGRVVIPEELPEEKMTSVLVRSVCRLADEMMAEIKKYEREKEKDDE